LKNVIRFAFRVGGTAALTSTFALTVAAQEPRFFYPPPAPGSVTTSQDVQYGAEDTAKLRMDVYRPAVASRTLGPVLIFFNGTGLPRDAAMYVGWARTAASKGLVAIVPDLRAEHAAQDFHTLITYLNEHAKNYGIDREAMAVYAGSGNVFTALPIVEDPNQTAIRAAVMFYGTAPVTQFRRDLPVLFVRAGLDRPSVTGATPPGITGLAALAILQNAPVTLLNNAAGHHAFETVDDDAATHDVIEQTIDWVKRATAGTYQAALRRGMPEATAAGEVATGQYSAAVAAYAAIVRARPNDARVRLAYGEALLGDRQYAAACSELAQLKGKGLGARDVGLPAARACALTGDSAAAIGWLASIPSQFLPPDVADDPAFAQLRTRTDFQALFQTPR
jgi:dienelactone hydrolase